MEISTMRRKETCGMMAGFCSVISVTGLNWPNSGKGRD
jgi:hypothetical protein